MLTPYKSALIKLHDTSDLVDSDTQPHTFGDLLTLFFAQREKKTKIKVNELKIN